MNILSTYNVLEAATRLGVRSIVFASSETTYGICFAQGERRPLYVPVDEDHPTVPEDAYAMSKAAGEVTARSFHARTGADVYGPADQQRHRAARARREVPRLPRRPSLRRRNLFAYIDAHDLGQMVQCCLETDGPGYETRHATSLGTPHASLLARRTARPRARTSTRYALKSR